MTRAPANLLAVRSLLLEHLDDAPGPDDLEAAEAGIVGDSAHRGGYHCGSDRLDSDDYSVDESPRDRAGLTLDAAALDVGEFAVTVDGRTYDLPHFSAWCVGQCRAKASDALDIREIIWSPDGRTVLRWDALGIRATGDATHRWHTHFSFFRDAIKAGRDQRPLFRRYLTTIGLIGEPPMEYTEFVGHLRKAITTDAGVREALRQAPWEFLPADHGGKTSAHAIALNGVPHELNLLRADVAQALGGVEQLRDRVEQLATATGLDPAALADALADRLAARLAE